MSHLASKQRSLHDGAAIPHSAHACGGALLAAWPTWSYQSQEDPPEPPPQQVKWFFSQLGDSPPHALPHHHELQKRGRRQYPASGTPFSTSVVKGDGSLRGHRHHSSGRWSRGSRNSTSEESVVKRCSPVSASATTLGCALTTPVPIRPGSWAAPCGTDTQPIKTEDSTP